ncbi:hypothetical protein TNCV_2847921 [Trichonephila clavipes]|nr:hypothetical protein TNCV_2847921 [Trichonephila clavipes]
MGNLMVGASDSKPEVLVLEAKANDRHTSSPMNATRNFVWPRSDTVDQVSLAITTTPPQPQHCRVAQGLQGAQSQTDAKYVYSTHL